jgi:hypothetical protein
MVDAAGGGINLSNDTFSTDFTIEGEGAGTEEAGDTEGLGGVDVEDSEGLRGKKDKGDRFSDVGFTSKNLLGLAGVAEEDYSKKDIKSLGKELDLDKKQQKALLEVFDSDGDGAFSKKEVAKMKELALAAAEGGMGEDDLVTVDQLQRFMSDSDSDGSSFNITEAKTVTGVIGLDETRFYSASDLVEQIPTMTEEEATALVAQFGNEGSSELSPLGVATMKEVFKAAVADGKFNDDMLSSEDVESYLSAEAITQLVDLPAPKEGAPYTVDSLMIAAPDLTRQNASELIELFDADGSKSLDAEEVSDLQSMLNQVLLEDGDIGAAHDPVSIEDLDDSEKPDHKDKDDKKADGKHDKDDKKADGKHDKDDKKAGGKDDKDDKKADGKHDKDDKKADGKHDKDDKKADGKHDKDDKKAGGKHDKHDKKAGKDDEEDDKKGGGAQDSKSADQLIELFDKSGNGSLEKKEVKAAEAAIKGAAKAAEGDGKNAADNDKKSKSDEAINSLIKIFDSNGDQKLDETEIKAAKAALETAKNSPGKDR